MISYSLIFHKRIAFSQLPESWLWNPKSSSHMGKVRRSCQHCHQRNCWSLPPTALFLLWWHLIPPHSPQNMERNKAADLPGGCSPRSLASSPPGKVYFSPQQTAFSHLRTAQNACSWLYLWKVDKSFQMQQFPLVLSIFYGYIPHNFQKYYKTELNLFIFPLPFIEIHQRNQFHFRGVQGGSPYFRSGKDSGYLFSDRSIQNGWEDKNSWISQNKSLMSPPTGPLENQIIRTSTGSHPQQYMKRLVQETIKYKGNSSNLRHYSTLDCQTFSSFSKPWGKTEAGTNNNANTTFEKLNWKTGQALSICQNRKLTFCFQMYYILL